MAIAVVFDVPGMTAEQYDKVIQALESEGAAAPEGRVYHVAAPANGGWFVFDIWESEEKFGAFSGVLIPKLQAAGVTPADPRIYPVHKIIAA